MRMIVGAHGVIISNGKTYRPGDILEMEAHDQVQRLLDLGRATLLEGVACLIDAGLNTLSDEIATIFGKETEKPSETEAEPKPYPMAEPELELQDKPEAPKPDQQVKAKARAKAHKAGKR